MLDVMLEQGMGSPDWPARGMRPRRPRRGTGKQTTSVRRNLPRREYYASMSNLLMADEFLMGATNRCIGDGPLSRLVR